jgi:hypothetical protein
LLGTLLDNCGLSGAESTNYCNSDRIDTLIDRLRLFPLSKWKGEVTEKNLLTGICVLINIGFPPLLTLTPKLPLRALPDILAKTELAIRPGIDCIEVVAWRRRYSSRGLEGPVLILLTLEAELRAGILGGSLSSPGRTE